MEFVIATHNRHKVEEFTRILAPLGVEAVTAELTEPEENGRTFMENAYIKAASACRETGCPSIADDSGLVVDVVAEGQQPAGVTIVSGVEIEPVKAGEKLNFAKEQDQDTVPELIGQIIDQVEGVTSIDLANRGNITVYVGEQYVIYFGTNTQIDYKLQMINAVLQKQSFTGWTYLDASNAGKVVTGIYTPPAEQTEQAEETEQTEQTNQGEQQTQTEEENAQTEE